MLNTYHSHRLRFISELKSQVSELEKQIKRMKRELNEIPIKYQDKDWAEEYNATLKITLTLQCVESLFYEKKLDLEKKVRTMSLSS